MPGWNLSGLSQLNDTLCMPAAPPHSCYDLHTDVGDLCIQAQLTAATSSWTARCACLHMPVQWTIGKHTRALNIA